MTESIRSRRTFVKTVFAGSIAGLAGQARTAVASSPVPTAEKPLAGKVAFVTGAARGIGRAIAEELAAHGAHIALVDIAEPRGVASIEGFRLANRQELAAAAAAVRSRGVRALELVCDVRDLAALEEAAARTTAELGGLDIVVANAGYVAWSRIAEASVAEWEDVVDVNVNGTWKTIRATVPHLRRRGGGRIVTISSIGGRVGIVGNGAYTATKWAVIGLTKSAALELGPENITVNSVAPGPVNTPMYRSEGQLRSMGLTSFSEQDRVVGAALPIKAASALDPAQIADAVAFLVSDKAKYISGEVLDVALGFNASYTA